MLSGVCFCVMILIILLMVFDFYIVVWGFLIILICLISLGDMVFYVVLLLFVVFICKLFINISVWFEFVFWVNIDVICLWLLFVVILMFV